MVLVVWDNWCEHVCCQLSTFLTRAALTDVTICVGSKMIKAHRIILSLFSPFFREMLADISDECPVIILFPDVNYQALRIIVSYMYEGQISVPADMLPHVTELAKMLKVNGLLKLPFCINSVIAGTEVKIAGDEDELEQIIEDRMDFASEADDIVELEVTKGENEPRVSSNLRAVSSRTAVTVITDTSPCMSPKNASTLHGKENYASIQETSASTSLFMHNRKPNVSEGHILIQSEDIQLSTVDDLTPTHVVKLSEDNSMSEMLFSDDYIQEDGSSETAVVSKECRDSQEEEGLSSRSRDGIYRIAKYGPDDLVRALEDLKAGFGTLREISERWGVPRSTLSVSARMAGISQIQKCPEYNTKALEEAKLAVKAGSSYMKAAKEYNIPKSVLWRKCQGDGVYRKAEHRFYNYSREDLMQARQMLCSGHSLTDIVKETKIPKTSVFRLKEQLVREGKMPASCITRNFRPRKPSEGSLQQAVVACTEEGMSLSQASEKLQVAKTTVWRRLKKFKRLESSGSSFGESKDCDTGKHIIKVEAPNTLDDPYNQGLSVKYCEEEEDGRFLNKKNQNFASIPTKYNHRGLERNNIHKQDFPLVKAERVDVSVLESPLHSVDSHTVIMEAEDGYLASNGTVIHSASSLSIKQENNKETESPSIKAENSSNTHFQLEVPLVNFHGGGYQVVGSEIVIGGQHMVVLDSTESAQHSENITNRHIVVAPFTDMDVTAGGDQSVQASANDCEKQNERESEDQGSYSDMYHHSQASISVPTGSAQDVTAGLQSMKSNLNSNVQKCVPPDRMTALITEFMSVD